MYDNDTIAAIATGYTSSAIGIIRVSGKNSIAILKKVFSKDIDFEANRVYYGHILDKNGTIIDEVLVSVFMAPRSYTGENSFEVNCHGGYVVLNAVLERLFEVGARMALPGEFTKRAYLNGKIDLSQAEAISKIISSKSKRALSVAQRQLSGKFSNKLDKIRESIIFIMAENEVVIDHPEEELSNTTKQEKVNKLLSIKEKLQSILKSSEFGNYLFEGIVLSLVGRPNVGKSSLLNILTGLERAIVTDIPGTTRDVISEQFTIRGIPFTILDTAGIRKTDDPIESIGVSKSKEAIKNSDIVVAIFDGSKDLQEEDIRIIEDLQKIDKKIVAVVNKIDKKIILDKNRLNFKNIVEVSCTTKKGIIELEDMLSKLSLGDINDADIVSLNAKQKNSLKNSIEICDLLIHDVKKDIDPALFAVDIANLVDELDEIVGRITNEDMLDSMFKNFCIGK